MRYGISLFRLTLLAATLLFGSGCNAQQGSRTSLPPSQGPLKEKPLQDITPADSFFVVQVGGRAPTVNARTFRVQIKGMVNRPLNLSVTDLASFKQTEQTVTVECIENPSGGSLIGTGRWGGVLLSDVLARAGVRGMPRTIVFRAADGYEESIPYSLLQRSPVMLVLRLNGRPLPADQGYPVRLIIPGLYGMKHVKWVQSIELIPGDFRGFWEKRGWSDKAEVFVKSWIYRVDPSPQSRNDRVIRGTAYAGLHKVARIDVSTDGGRTWKQANTDRTVGPYAWSIWSYKWINPSRGTHQLAVRATDSDGNTQPAVDTNYLDGNNGIQSVTYSIR